MILIACSEYQRHYGGGFDFLKNLLWSSLTIIRQNVNMATNALWLDLCSGSLMYSIYVTDVISLLSQGGREGGGRKEGREGGREGVSEGVREGGREGGREGDQDQAWSLSWEPPTEQQHPKQQFTRINGPDSYRMYLPSLPSSSHSLSHSPAILNLQLPPSLSLYLPIQHSHSPCILPLCLSLSPPPPLLPSPSLFLPPHLHLPPIPLRSPFVALSLSPPLPPTFRPPHSLYRPPPLSLSLSPSLSLFLSLSISLSLSLSLSLSSLSL